MDEELEAAKERGWREIRAIDDARAAGDLDDEGWHRAVAAIVIPAYLAADTPQGGSGHTGSPEDWEYSRGIVADAIDRSGTFLDVGCANGLLMESVARWSAEKGFAVEPYGLDVSAELAAAARARVPQWAGRIFVGNALGWKPPVRFDIVRTGLEYVPSPRRRELLEWLLENTVAPGGRVVVGKFNEELERATLEESIVAWGFRITGRAERPHRSEPRLAYRVLWIDV